MTCKNTAKVEFTSAGRTAEGLTVLFSRPKTGRMLLSRQSFADHLVVVEGCDK